MAQLARAKKAEKVVVLDVRELSSFCDYFVILSCSSVRQVQAIALSAIDDLASYGIKPLSKVSRTDESGWLALDFSSVVMHIFYKPMREFYSLEHLWADAKRVRIR